jgi:tetratricopeptide (TPR) repeat protein
VREVAPAMQPKIYAVEEGYKIRLAQAPLGDPKLEYRKEVERLAKQRDGQLSPILQRGLAENFRGRLSAGEIETILHEVLQPYREFEEKLKKYQDAVTEFMALPATQQFPEDLEYFQAALGLRDEDIAVIKQQLGIGSISKPSNSKAAEDFFTRSISKPSNSKTAEDFFTEGFEKYNNQDYPGAIADYDQAIKLKPDYAFAYNNRGIARRALGDNKGAIADYDQAIKLKPDYATAYYNRGIARSALGDNKGAIADYDQAIKLKPDYADAYNNRGIARRALGDNKGAIADYDQSIKLKPDAANAYYSRAYVYALLNENRKAIADYQKAIELYPADDPWRQKAIEEIKKLQSDSSWLQQLFSP